MAATYRIETRVNRTIAQILAHAAIDLRCTQADLIRYGLARMYNDLCSARVNGDLGMIDLITRVDLANRDIDIDDAWKLAAKGRGFPLPIAQPTEL